MADRHFDVKRWTDLLWELYDKEYCERLERWWSLSDEERRAVIMSQVQFQGRRLPEASEAVRSDGLSGGVGPKTKP